MADAPPVQLHCPHCHTLWPNAPGQSAAPAPCPRCGVETRVVLFPALNRPADLGATAVTALMDGEATCFYHPQKRAHVPCDACGRFLCALCDLDLNGRHLCPACLESGARKGRIQELERQRTRWDQITWTVLILPPLVSCGFLAPVAALAGLGILAWKRKAPLSIVDNARLSLGLATAVAGLEMVGGIVEWLLAAFS